ncbi:MAG TPA: DUF5615 family PIN-like protein [Stellaceae bacterium]|jgi:predicted nuclease of predicted toxin-antitoxin system|nr:DUF5615 family PIN-like protein [Stellaceae bacterium]
MRFLLDMNISPLVSETLRASGHDAVHARNLGSGEMSDRALFERAAAEDRVVVTFDLDFGDIAGSVGSGAPGVVLLRLRSSRRAHMLNRLMTAIATAGDALAAGAIVLVEDGRIRIRRPNAIE